MMNSPRVAAIILAAGKSSRFGAPKQLLDWRGQPLLRHVTMQALAAPVSEVIVVIGAYVERVAPIIHGLPVTLAINRTWWLGMSGSVRLGLRAIRGTADAALFLLADQPGVTPKLCQRIIRAYATANASIVAPRAGNQPGNPVLFDHALFHELMQVTGDQGGRLVMQTHKQNILWLQTDVHILTDIDTPDDARQTSSQASLHRNRRK